MVCVTWLLSRLVATSASQSVYAPTASLQLGVNGGQVTCPEPFAEIPLTFDKDKVLDNGDLKTVAGTINKFFIPATEAEKAQAAEKNVEIEIGDSEDVVIKKLGEPVKSVRVGSQKILKFKDLTVILKDGKVADVKIE